MTTATQLLTKRPTSKYTLSLLLIFTLSASSTTSDSHDNQAASVNQNNTLQAGYIASNETTIKCQTHAKNIASHAEEVASTAQYLAAAKAMDNCVSSALQNRGYNNDKPTEQDNIMKMMAVATLNFIKAGDVITAAREVEKFKRIYPNQDLYFADYSSFLDTTTALLSIEPLAASQMSSLNISRALRDEIERKHYWLNH